MVAKLPECQRCPSDEGEKQEPAPMDLFDTLLTVECGADDDETAHRIAVLRDDADMLDRIKKRHELGFSHGVGRVATHLRDEADRLEGDSA